MDIMRISRKEAHHRAHHVMEARAHPIRRDLGIIVGEPTDGGARFYYTVPSASKAWEEALIAVGDRPAKSYRLSMRRGDFELERLLTGEEAGLFHKCYTALGEAITYLKDGDPVAMYFAGDGDIYVSPCPDIPPHPEGQMVAGWDKLEDLLWRGVSGRITPCNRAVQRLLRGTALDILDSILANRAPQL